MHVLKKVGVAAATLAAAASAISLASPAFADTGARSGDAVGVGSDTLQNAADFVFDGSPGVAGGYNNVGNINRVMNVFATGDANGRLPYDGTCGTAQADGLGQFCDSTTNQSPNALATSVILRAGTKPVLRPNGSGSGVGALIADAPAANGQAAGPGYEGLPNGSIQFARMSRLPNSTEIGNCSTTSSCGGLHVYQAATDDLGIARIASGSNAPAGLSAQELIGIYQCTITKWSDMGSGLSSDTIHPLIPQSGSGTRTFFLQELTNANNGTTVNPGACVRTVQEHDPTGIYADSAPKDSIEPFSKAKLQLINSGYFAHGVSYAGAGAANGAYTPGYLSLMSGAAPDGNATFTTSRGVYFVVRQSDVSSTTPFQPGAAANFTTALFTGASSAIRSVSGRAEIAAAGFTPQFKDCGINPTTC